MPGSTILLVDDDQTIRDVLSALLRHKGFEVTVAATVIEALKLINSERYDVLLTDQHMPGAGDGLCVISAMRHANPKTVALLLSSFPEMKAAADALVSLPDDILVKPMEISDLADAITERLSQGRTNRHTVESVAMILKRSTQECIQDWFDLVQQDNKLTKVPLTREDRCSHLPQVFSDLIERMDTNRPLGIAGPLSASAAAHGLIRRKQGYAASMLVEESRILQVCLFQTLQKNLSHIDFSALLNDIMTIADEVDSRLRQAIDCYNSEAASECASCASAGRLQTRVIGSPLELPS
jgi:DNA-binding response OmpR family regulator